MQHSPTTLYNRLLSPLEYFQHPFLLVMRLYWGYQFYLAGKGKLMNLDRTTEFFVSINIPLPKLNAMMAGSIECFGGLLLLIGLGSRVISLPLSATMIVAYLTAHREELMEIFKNPEGFIGAPPFLFLLTALIVLAFGPGLFSIDTIINKFLQKPQTATTDIKPAQVAKLA
jgi:putative oxidoreductase